MFRRVVTTDLRVIIRGLLILLAIVAIGVGIAEYQLAALTQQPTQERFFYIGRNEEHIYSAYAFGYGLTFGSMYPIGTVSLAQRMITLKVANHTITVPTKIEIDGSQARYWLDVWKQQFITEAVTAKKTATDYWWQVKPAVEGASRILKVKMQQAIQQIKDYMREYR